MSELDRSRTIAIVPSVIDLGVVQDSPASIREPQTVSLMIMRTELEGWAGSKVSDRITLTGCRATAKSAGASEL